MRLDLSLKVPKVRMPEVRERSMSSDFQDGRSEAAIFAWVFGYGFVVGWWDAKFCGLRPISELLEKTPYSNSTITS